MLTMQEVEHGIERYATVELGGELAFPPGMTRDQAYDHLRAIAGQVGGMVTLTRTVAHEQLLIYPPDETGYWLLTWRDGEIEVARYKPETKTFKVKA